MGEFQPKLHYEDLDDALHDLVLALGGYKAVGPMLWPPEPSGKTVEEAAQLLRHCLNKNRREKLSHRELVYLLRKGRELGFHNAMAYFADVAGYEPPRALSPKDEATVLIERAEALARESRNLTAALERLTRAPLTAVTPAKSA